MKIKLSATYDQDSKRYHRFSITSREGIKGLIYIPKGKDIPELLTISLQTPTDDETNKGLVAATIRNDTVQERKSSAHD